MVTNNNQQYIVMSTAKDAMKAKYATVQANYYNDPFLSSFVASSGGGGGGGGGEFNHHRTGSPSSSSSYIGNNDPPVQVIIKRGTYARVTCIEHCIHTFLTLVEEQKLKLKHLSLSSSDAQIVILGSGYDTCPFRIQQQQQQKQQQHQEQEQETATKDKTTDNNDVKIIPPIHVSWFEIDHQDIINDKVRIIKQQQQQNKQQQQQQRQQYSMEQISEGENNNNQNEKHDRSCPTTANTTTNTIQSPIELPVVLSSFPTIVHEITKTINIKDTTTAGTASDREASSYSELDDFVTVPSYSNKSNDSINYIDNNYNNLNSNNNTNYSTIYKLLYTYKQNSATTKTKTKTNKTVIVMNPTNVQKYDNDTTFWSHTLIGYDLCDDPNLLIQELLVKHSGYNPLVPTLIITECVQMYMPYDKNYNLLQAFTHITTSVAEQQQKQQQDQNDPPCLCLCCYEPILGRSESDSFGKMMECNFKRAGYITTTTTTTATTTSTPTTEDDDNHCNDPNNDNNNTINSSSSSSSSSSSKSVVTRCRTVQDYVHLFHTIGFTTTIAGCDMEETYRTVLSKSIQSHANRIEFLDEMEEFYLIMKHYCYIIATLTIPPPCTDNVDNDNNTNDTTSLSLSIGTKLCNTTSLSLSIGTKLCNTTSLSLSIGTKLCNTIFKDSRHHYHFG